jgi:hypothetical protein
MREDRVFDLIWSLAVLAAIVTLTLAEAPTAVVLALIASLTCAPSVRSISPKDSQATLEEL